jgi:diguanylate cyclase (GGDEF)-like protein
MLKAIRVEDVLARFGGDEFVLLARATPGDHAARLAERLRRAVEELRFSSAAHAPVVTVSIGLASLTELDPHDAPAALLALADERLYGAKLRGRNQVCANT